ncbi:MAG: MBG domain-containing protein, partial [Thermaurantiacus sp.]
GVFVEHGAVIDADSAGGRGGEVILWSERRTRFDGLIRADGPLGGGFVETSSKDMLQITSGRVQAGSGQWLLDPRNVVILATVGDDPGPPTPPDWVINPPEGPGNYQILRGPLQDALNAGTNVTVTTDAPGPQPGNIVVSAIVQWSGSGNLTLLADANIAVNQRIQTDGAGSLFLTAGAAITSGTNGQLRSEGSGNITLNAGTNAFLTGNDIITTGGGSISVTAQNEIVVNRNVEALGSGNVTLTALGDGIRYQLPTTVGNRRIFANTGIVSLNAPGADGDITLFRGATNSNIQVFSNTGAVALTAGRDVILRSISDGGWVRVGRQDQLAPVSIAAGRDIRLEGNGQTAQGNAFAEVASAGAIALTAGRNITLDANGGTGTAARVTAVGPSLVVTAPDGLFAGRVLSRGDTLFQGGDYRFTVKPDFLLDADRSFTLASDSSITSVQFLEIRAPGAGNITLLGPVDGFDFLGVAGNEFTIGAPITMLGSNTGETSLTIVAGSRIINTAGAAPLSAPNSRWLTYSVSPFDDVGEELLEPDTFNLYNRTFAANPPATILPLGESRRIYSFQPTLTLTAESATKRAGTEGPPLGFEVDGLVPGDLLAIALNGTPQVVSEGQPATAPAGTYPTLFTPGLAASDQGYLLVLVPGLLTVEGAILMIRADDITKLFGQADPALTFTAT